MKKYLSKKSKNIIHKFHQHDTPLCIFGPPGSGKSTLANELLKDTIILTIDTSDIYKYKNINLYINDTLLKKNITLMFHQGKDRSLIIDDLHIFLKNDYHTFKSLIKYINQSTNYKIIITFNNDLDINKYITIPYYMISLPDHPMMLSNILDDKIKYNNILNFNEKEKILKLMNGNIHKLNKYIHNLKINDDMFDSINILMDKVIKNKYSINELINISKGYEIFIGLNLLDSIDKYINIQNFSNNLPIIYKNCIYADISETFMIKNQDVSFKSTFNIFYLFNQKYIQKKSPIITHNKYMSKSSIIAQENYSDKDLRKILINIYEAYEKNDKFFLKKNKKYKNIFYEIYNIKI